MSASNDHLREKIDEAKRLLPMPKVLEKFGLGAHAKKEARCPFPDHEDKHPSFSIWQVGGAWFWKCHSKCGSGDEISFIQKYKGLSRSAAIGLYLEMAGFPAQRPPQSHEYPSVSSVSQSPQSLGISGFPECPMSNGQGLDKELEALAARNACTQCKPAKKGLWQLARDVRAVEKQIGRKLSNGELMRVFDECHQLSQPFLDPPKTRDQYLAELVAGLRKVRVPTGEGDTLNKALATVAKLSPDELPAIPEVPNAPERLRRIAALHRELSRLCGGKTYFLTCRDTAKVFPGLSHQAAWNVNGALAQLGVIKVVRVGDARPNGKASKFHYLLS